jgi:hypothetical protein
MPGVEGGVHVEDDGCERTGGEHGGGRGDGALTGVLDGVEVVQTVHDRARGDDDDRDDVRDRILVEDVVGQRAGCEDVDGDREHPRRVGGTAGVTGEAVKTGVGEDCGCDR